MLPLPKQPIEVEFLELPDDISDVDSSILTNLMAKYAAWASYADYEATKAEVEHMKLEKGLQQAVGRAMSLSGGKSVAAKKASAAGDPEVINIKESLSLAYERMTLIRSIMRGYERKNTVASRELSRRQSRSY